MKQIKVKPIQVAPIRVSPILVTSTSVESIRVSGESGETVDTRPMWVEVDREYGEPYCTRFDADCYCNGTAYRQDTIIYENQNENSATYGTTKTVHDIVEYEDLVNCPLPLTAPLPNEGLYPNAVQDYDGNYYDAVIIGNQVWLASNLHTLHYANGDSVSDIKYPNDDSNLKEEYGVLYNYDTVTKGATITDSGVSVQGIAPDGWLVPSWNDWQALLSYLYTNKYYSASTVRYKKITKGLSSKSGWSTSISNTESPGYNPQTNNKTYFNAKAAGYTNLQSDHTFSFASACYFYSCMLDLGNSTGSKLIYWGSGSDEVSFSTLPVANKASVRCIYDGTVEQFLANYVDLNPSNS